GAVIALGPAERRLSSSAANPAPGTIVANHHDGLNRTHIGSLFGSDMVRGGRRFRESLPSTQKEPAAPPRGGSSRRGADSDGSKRVSSGGMPAGTGFVASLARPGGHVTGLTNQSSDLPGKILQLAREVAP